MRAIKDLSKGIGRTVFLSLVLLALAAPSPAANDTPDWVAPFADRVFEAWRDGEPMPQISVAYPDATLGEAYSVQRHFVARMLETEAIGGYKAAGVANPAPEFPLIAVMPASGVFYARDAVVIDLADDPNRHVENEIGFIIDAAITAPVSDIETLREYVAAIVAIVEVPGNPVEEEQPATENDIVAWNINGKDMILGETHDPDSIDPDAIEIRFTRNGAVINEARGDMAAGGQWHTLLKTVNHIVEQGYTLAPGHIITNGALANIVPAEPGHHRADYGPLGVIEFEVR